MKLKIDVSDYRNVVASANWLKDKLKEIWQDSENKNVVIEIRYDR